MFTMPAISLSPADVTSISLRSKSLTLLRAGQVDSGRHERQFGGGEFHALAGVRDFKSAGQQSLVPRAPAVAVPDQDLSPVIATVLNTNR